MNRLPMSPDEAWVAFIATIVALWRWARWYLVSLAEVPLTGKPPSRATLVSAPFIAATVILVVLQRAASFDVVSDLRYIYMYFVLGMAWVGIGTMLFPWVGLFVRDDVIERRNPAVGPAAAGAILGLAAAYAGGNIGDGPGWWVVVACAFWATVAFFGAWHALAYFTAVTDAITIDRDRAAGWRLGAFLAATGLMLGRSVAGDWVSTEATLRDAATTGWPVLALLAFAITAERLLRPSAARPRPPVITHGFVPAVVMLVLACSWIANLGYPQ